MAIEVCVEFSHCAAAKFSPRLEDSLHQFVVGLSSNDDLLPNRPRPQGSVHGTTVRKGVIILRRRCVDRKSWREQERCVSAFTLTSAIRSPGVGHGPMCIPGNST